MKNIFLGDTQLKAKKESGGKKDGGMVGSNASAANADSGQALPNASNDTAASNDTE